MLRNVSDFVEECVTKVNSSTLLLLRGVGRVLNYQEKVLRNT